MFANFKSLDRLLAALVTTLCLAFSLPAHAQWWQFGADNGQPVLSELLFNRISALRVERSLQFSPEDLDSRKVVVRGRAEVAQGKIGKVEASLDDGVTWTPIPFGDRGLFAFEFMPEMERAYRFKIRALSTTGKSSDEAEHAFEFKLVREDGRMLAKAAFEKLLERYTARDRAGFMALVAQAFQGNATALDSALSNDFRFFDSIRIQPTVQRISASDGRWTVYFSFMRQVRSVRTGQLLQDQAATSVTLVREGDSFKLEDLAAPLIFGVSDPENIATFVTDESVGKTVLTVDRDGNASTTTQGQSTQPASPSMTTNGSVTLASSRGYVMSSGQSVNIGFGGTTFFAFGPEGNIIFFGDEVDSAQILAGVSSLTTVRSVPAVLGDKTMIDTALVIGRVYALKLIDGTYAIVQMTNQGGGPMVGPWTFQYRHQRNGTPNF